MPRLLACALLALPASAQTVFFADFESGVAGAFSGIVTTEPTQGFAAFGFGTAFLRNGSGCPAMPTTLTLANLPPHDLLDIDFLLAIIDTWDGTEPCCGTDRLQVTVDGQIVFAESFKNAFGGGHPYVAPVGVTLAQQLQLGFRATNVDDQDSAFNMAFEPSLSAIPHTASTVTIDWLATGSGWHHQCLGANQDESWGIDNVRVTVGFATNSREAVRRGAPRNPFALRPGQTSGPVLGQVWDPFVDHGTFMPAAILDCLFLSVSPSNAPIPPFGTMLVDPATAAAIVLPASSTFPIQLPASLVLAGSTFHTQALSLQSNGAILVTNAIDIVIGTL